MLGGRGSIQGILKQTGHVEVFDGVLLQVLRELADGIPRLLSKIFEQS